MHKLKKFLSLAFIFGLMNPMSATRIAVAQELNLDGFYMDLGIPAAEKKKVPAKNSSKKPPRKNASETQTQPGCTNCSDNQANPPTAAQSNPQDLKNISNEIAKQSAASKDHNEAFYKADPVISKYSNSAAVQGMIDYALKHRAPSSQEECYKAAKFAMAKGGKFAKSKWDIKGKYARDAVKELTSPEHGFINLLDDPKYKDLIKHPDDAPKGALIVYHNGVFNKDNQGDIQIKTDWGKKGVYVSDFLQKNGRTYFDSPKAQSSKHKGKPYKMIGVLIKPM